MRRTTAAAAVTLAATLTLAACGSGGSTKGSAAAPTDPKKVSGNITVLTNRTDLQKDGTLARYAKEFNKIYPKVHVKFQGLTDYEGETKIRMNTSNYGDVLLIPQNVTQSDYPTFFAPLGTQAELSKKYDFTDFGTVNGKVYGLVSYSAVSGFVYNKTVWAKAGITSWPTSPTQFLSDLAKVKAKTGATPYYTNYKDGWPLTQWTSLIGDATCDANAYDKLADTDAPWSKGTDLYQGDSLLFDIVHDKLSESDPTTTNWENSKSLLANGKISSMWLGSWALPQMQQAAEKAGKSASEIGYMPFPSTATGGYCSVESPDYKYAVSIHSAHKAAARAWVDFMIDKSDFATANSGISSVKGAALPAALKGFETNHVKLLVENQAKATTVGNIDKDGEVGINAPDYRQNLIDVARGAKSGSLAGVFSGLNAKWKTGRQSAGS
jgi:ABC-type glycerol-3-phosphate transport system substrate-binding protein